MNENFFNHINIDLANTFLPNGVAADLDSECRRFDDLCGALGFTDVQILDIGTHGQIGFNEPRNILRVGTHVEDLTSETIDAYRSFESDEEIPKRHLLRELVKLCARNRSYCWPLAKKKHRLSEHLATMT